LRQTITPFAAIVFERAYPSKKNIIREMAKLREELAPFRIRMRKYEKKAFWSDWDENNEAENKWQEVLNEIEKSFGKEPKLITFKRGLGFGEALGELVQEPHKIGSWTKLLLGQPLEVTQRMLLRAPVIEIHQLRKNLPGPPQLWKTASRLFGDIADT
jgi:hypothetical protein